MEEIRAINPIGHEYSEHAGIKKFEFSRQKSLIQETYVKSYQMDPDMAQQKISDSIYQLIESKNVRLDFEVDMDRGLILVKVINEITGDVIREIPLSTILYADKNMKGIRGMLFDKKV
jgi:uncharacterized FlaG/YvyC family protein